MFDSLFNNLQQSALAQLLDGSRYIAITVQILHILGFVFLLAIVLALTLRIQRLALLGSPVASFVGSLQRAYQVSLRVSIAAGVLLFIPRAIAYGNNPAMFYKVVFLILAVLVQAFVHRSTRALAVEEEVGPVLRATSWFALLLWFAAGGAGRAIGFV